MKSINISICSCGKFLDKHSWRSYKEIREIITRRIRELLPKAKVSIKPVELPENKKERRIVQVVALCKGKEYKPQVVVKMSRCNLCEKEGSKYFEAILQIRGKNEAILEKSVDFLQERISGLKQRGVFINKIERFENGFDLFMTSNKLTQVMGRELLNMFGGELKISPRLFSKSHLTSKDIYRVNVFIELPEFARGDFIIQNERVYLVEKVGKKIILRDMQNNSHLITDYNKLEYKVLPRQKAYVSKTYPQLEVINPHDYQSSMVKNKPERAYVNGEHIDVVIYKGIYVVE